MELILPSILMLCGLSLAFGVGLAYASRVFSVSTDPRIEQVAEVLPGANCGACGFAGCAAYAEVVVGGVAAPGLCTAGGTDTAAAVGQIMGVEVQVAEKQIAAVHCRGRAVASRFVYDGLEDCRAAVLLQDGFKACAHGCLGLGSCVVACPFDAIRMDNGLPVVDPERCVACGKCVEACPRGIIRLHRVSAEVQVLCRSTDKGGVVRKTCKEGCIGCKKCEKACEFDAIRVENFLAEVDDEKCTKCGKCVEACPTKVVTTFL